MDIVTDILLWLHLLGLAAGGGALATAAVLARLVPAGGAESRAGYMAVGAAMTRIGRGGLAVLIVTGGLMLWLKWGGRTPSDAWFGIKMLFVLVVLAGVIVMGVAQARAGRGDASAAVLAERARIAASVGLVIAVLAAALTFG